MKERVHKLTRQRKAEEDERRNLQVTGVKGFLINSEDLNAGTFDLFCLVFRVEILFFHIRWRVKAVVRSCVFFRSVWRTVSAVQRRYGET